MPDDQASPGPRAGAHPDADRELNAITTVVAALKPLKEAERRSVLEYVLRRFGAVPLQPALSTQPPTPSPIVAPSPPHPGTTSVQDRL
jgi:hypothetical protein